MTTIATSRPGAMAEPDARFIPNLLAPLGRALSDILLYRKTLAELRALTNRQREDIGFARRDLAAIAHRAVYA